jgi:hypothetical protein
MIPPPEPTGSPMDEAPCLGDGNKHSSNTRASFGRASW